MATKKTTNEVVVKQTGTTEGVEAQVVLEGLASMSKRVQESVANITGNQLRYLVDSYYQTQEYRKAIDNQIRSMQQGYDGEGADVPMAVDWLAKNVSNQELQIKKMLDVYTDNSPVTRWMKATVGIGPVFAAALAAYLDITKAKYANQFMTYAGLNNYNNPWLGTAKANDLVDALLDYSEAKMATLVRTTFGDLPVKTAAEALDALRKSAKNTKKAPITPDEYKVNVLIPILTNGEIEQEYADRAIEANKFVEVLDSNKIDALLNTSISSGNELKDLLEKLPENHILKQQLFKIKRREQVADFYDPFNMPAIDTLVDLAFSSETKDTIYPACASVVTPSLVQMVAIAANRSVRSVNTLISEDDTITALKKQLAKPPYNQQLSTICWLMGDSFMKRSSNPKSLYGRLYKERKALETEKNLRGDYADLAAQQLKNTNYSKGTPTYTALSQGRLSDGQINERAKKYAVKIFISHVYEIMYMDYYKEPAMLYYSLVKDPLHNRYIAPEVPFSDFIDIPEGYNPNKVPTNK